MNYLGEVSILVTCFNKSEFLDSFRTQLESIKGHLPEIIIVDDLSQDGSRGILESIAHEYSNITLVLNEGNLGSAASRNIAMEHASKDWIFFWDIDDCINFSTLNDMISQAIQEESDLCRGQYAVSPSNEVIIEELPNESEPFSEISNSAKEIVRGMGYWRFLYSRRYLSINKVIFIPAFADLKSKFFILDDVFFLILVASTKGKLSFSKTRKPVYFYHPTSHDASSWRRFQKQASIFPKASLFCFSYIQSKENFNSGLAYELILDKTIAHMRYLNFSHLIISAPSFTRLIFLKVNSVNALSKFRLIISVLLQSVKNSLAAQFHRTSS